ncbi:MAG: S8 family serine peptidase [Isosphaeraceae bacterium]
MGWSRKPRRKATRQLHRPDMESLEIRSLLSIGLGSPSTVGSGSGVASTGVDAIIGATAARQQFQVDGSGMSVAVIDAGVNYATASLGSGYGAGHKVVGGYDFAYGDTDPQSLAIQHGTEVSNLIASTDASHTGVAPAANIVALRVFDDSDNGDFNKVADALQWVIDHHDTYNITVVNLSLSDGRNYTRNWFAQDGGIGERVTTLVSRLAAMNIPVVSATGNSYAGQQGSGFASIIPDTISVTATDDSDQLVANAQRLGADAGSTSATDIAAPGSGGTSFAAPLVSGAIVLMQQVYQARFHSLPTVADLDTWLTAGADVITDSSTGFKIGRLDIPGAIEQIPVPAPQILIPPTPQPTPPAQPVPDPVPTPADPAPVPSTPDVTPPALTDSTDSSLQLWVNGQAVTASDLANPDSRLAGMPSLFVRAIQALKGWWGGSSEGSSRVRVWSAGGTTTGNSQTLGTAATASNATRPRVQQAKTATTRSGTLLDSTPGKATSARPHSMPRAWQSFVTRTRTR